MKSLRKIPRTGQDRLRGVAIPLGIELSRAIRQPSFCERSHLGENMVSRCKVGTAQAHYGVEMSKVVFCTCFRSPATAGRKKNWPWPVDRSSTR